MSAPVRPRPHTLHVVRIDILLHALGGFAEPPVDMPRANGLPKRLSISIDRLAALPPTPHGALVLLAERFGRSRSAIGVHVHRTRRLGIRPQDRRRTA
jgi:hypothetical protein